MEGLRTELYYGDDIAFPKLILSYVLLSLGYALDLISTFWVLNTVPGSFEGNPVASQIIHNVPLTIFAKFASFIIVIVLIYYVYLRNPKVAFIVLLASIFLIYAVVAWNFFIVPSEHN